MDGSGCDARGHCALLILSRKEGGGTCRLKYEVKCYRTSRALRDTNRRSQCPLASRPSDYSENLGANSVAA